MSQVAEGSLSGAASVSSSEKNATSSVSTRTPASAPAPTLKLRSCVVCRNRKVRCDKQSPCSNCRRANIPCVLPSTDRPPRWARHLDRLTKNVAASTIPASRNADPDVDKVMDRLKNLENLVKELKGQLELAHAAANSAGRGSSGTNYLGSSTPYLDEKKPNDTSSTADINTVQQQFGRLVLQDASHSRYVSSSFWSRVNDELDGLNMDTYGLTGDESDSSEDEASPGKPPTTQELQRTPWERHAFLFPNNLYPSGPDLHELHPLPSQIPFLLDVFSENVNFFIRIVHMPTVTKMVRDLRNLGGSGMADLSPVNEALMFSIYYAAITSMEDDDVMANFGSSKSDLNFKYRLGVEHALAKADFLNAPNIVLVQAFAIFLFLVRRHDSPRFVWMMTGFLIRMAQYLGLQRDGTNFKHLTPFEIEMRRRTWWAVCMIDGRASEDQGTEFTITRASFDTKSPLNINDVDIHPESAEMPAERQGVTDMSFTIISVNLTNLMMRMMTPGGKDGVKSPEDQNRLLNEIYQKFEEGYFQYTTEPGNIAYQVGVKVARLVMAKMALIAFLPVIFSSSSEAISEETRTKFLISAIEVAEYNHELNAEQAFRKWRWIYQTYTHWYSIVYLLIEICRRSWSPIVERAWVALHSSWLIPAQAYTDKNLRIWVPLRKLMSRASKHRDAEVSRLKANPQAAAKLEIEDQKNPVPSSSGPFPTGYSAEIFRERWRQLVALPETAEDGKQTYGNSGTGFADSSMHTTSTNQPTAKVASTYGSDFNSNMTFEPTYLGASGQQGAQILESTNIRGLEPMITTDSTNKFTFEQPDGPFYNSFPTIPVDWSDGRTMGPGFVPWMWADPDPSVDVFSQLDKDSLGVDMEFFGGVNWYDWVESAKGMELDARHESL